LTVAITISKQSKCQKMNQGTENCYSFCDSPVVLSDGASWLWWLHRHLIMILPKLNTGLSSGRQLIQIDRHVYHSVLYQYPVFSLEFISGIINKIKIVKPLLLAWQCYRMRNFKTVRAENIEPKQTNSILRMHKPSIQCVSFQKSRDLPSNANTSFQRGFKFFRLIFVCSFLFLSGSNIILTYGSDVPPKSLAARSTALIIRSVNVCSYQRTKYNQLLAFDFNHRLSRQHVTTKPYSLSGHLAMKCSPFVFVTPENTGNKWSRDWCLVSGNHNDLGESLLVTVANLCESCKVAKQLSCGLCVTFMSGRFLQPSAVSFQSDLWLRHPVIYSRLLPKRTELHVVDKTKHAQWDNRVQPTFHYQRMWTQFWLAFLQQYYIIVGWIYEDWT
jgi:hypothetical protein